MLFSSKEWGRFFVVNNVPHGCGGIELSNCGMWSSDHRVPLAFRVFVCLLASFSKMLVCFTYLLASTAFRLNAVAKVRIIFQKVKDLLSHYAEISIST